MKTNIKLLRTKAKKTDIWTGRKPKSFSDLSLERDYTSKHFASQDLQSIKCKLSCVSVTNDSV